MVPGVNETGVVLSAMEEPLYGENVVSDCNLVSVFSWRTVHMVLLVSAVREVDRL